MRGSPLRAVLALLLILLIATSAEARTVTDSAGRKVEVPDKIERVFAAGPPASILLYMLAPEKMTGWPNPPTRGGAALHRAGLSRPAGARPPHRSRRHGQSRGGAEGQARPDPRLRLGARHLRLARRQRAGADQDPLRADRRPLRGDAGGAAAAGRHPGHQGARRAAGQIRRGDLRGDRQGAGRHVPPDKRPRVYLARGPDGLETGVVGSINTEIIERAGGRNVAEAAGQRGLVRASIEQVIVADPEIILTWDRNFFDRVAKDPLWADIRAVRENRVYLAPTAPFGWIDRPPSLNRVIGLKWLAGLFYPDKFTADLRETTRAFYRLFYHVDPSDAELDTPHRMVEGTSPVRTDADALGSHPAGHRSGLVRSVSSSHRLEDKRGSLAIITKIP